MFGLQFRSLHEFDESEGTVTLVDTVHHLKTKGDIVLIPQPSDDVNDPLNWPVWKKALAFCTIIGLTFMSIWVVGGLGVALLILTEEFGRGLNTTAQGLNGFCVLTFGCANFFWVPTALYIGKRPAFILASLLLFATSIWGAKATTFESLEAARILSAFAGASTEGLAAAINADLFFLHERGWWMGLYIFFLNTGATLGSLIAGFVVQSLGWRWHFWICSIFIGVNVVAIILFLPETQYRRKYITSAESGEIPDVNARQKDTTTETTVATIPKKSFLEELKPWSPLNPDTSYLHLLLRPWPLILYPAIFFSFLVFATTLAWVVCVIETYASIFQAPPYLMSLGVSGLINVSTLVGIFIGSYCGGALTDLISQKLSRKNNGVFEPEYRLVALIIPFFLIPVGLLMYGIGVQHQTSWAVPFIGYGFMSFGLAAVPSIVMTYVIDAYYPVAFEGLLLVNGLKNIFAFGFSYGIIPWITRSGFQGAFGTMVGIQSGVMLFAVPLYYYGKKIRHTSGSWKLISW